MSSDSEKYLRWRLSQAEEHHKKDQEEWFQFSDNTKFRIQNLKEEVSRLQLQVETQMKRENKLQDELRLTRKEADDNNELKRIHNNFNSVLRHELENCHKSHDKTLMELKKQIEDFKKDKVCMEADHHGMLEQQRKAFEEQAHQHQCQVELKDKQYHELEQEKKKALEKVAAERDEARQMTKTLQLQEIETKKATEVDKFNDTLKLNLRIELLRKEITQLKKREEQAQKKISWLKESIEDLEKALKNKVKMNEVVAKEKSNVVKLLTREEECSAILRVKLDQATDSNKLLQNEFEHLDSKRMAALQLLLVATKKEYKQEDKMTTLKNQIVGMRSGVTELKERVCKLETFQKRFLEDLQACMPLVYDHKKLEKKIIALKEYYIDKNRHNLINESTDAGYKHKIANLEGRLSKCERVIQDHSKTVKDMELRHQKAIDQLKCNTEFYVNCHKDKTMQMLQLKEELKESQIQTFRLRARCWLRKTILRSPTFAPDVAEEPLVLLPDDRQSPSLPKDCNRSSPPPSQPYSSSDDDNVIFVRPYVADGVQQVDN